MSRTSGGAGGGGGLPKTTVTKPADPAGTVSTAVPVMMGLGGVATYTPQASAKVLVRVTGLMWNATPADGLAISAASGVGAPPANGAAAAGVAFGRGLTEAGVASAAAAYPFTIEDTVAGLAAGVAIWVDLQVTALIGGTANVKLVTVTFQDVA